LLPCLLRWRAATDRNFNNIAGFVSRFAGALQCIQPRLQIVVNINENSTAAFEISAKNRKNDENNKREQAEFNKIGHLSEASR
jgi:hypothetical protein